MIRLPARWALESLEARELTIAAAVLVIVLEIGGVAVMPALRAGVVPWLVLAHALVSAGVVVALLAYPSLDARFSTAAFVLLVLPTLPLVWLVHTSAILRGDHVMPLVGRKVMLLSIALLTPYSAIVASVLLALVMGEWLALWVQFDLGSDPLMVQHGEPWGTLLYLCAAEALVLMRWRSRRLTHALVTTATETDALRRLADASVAVRDQVNTALQVLELSVSLFARRHPSEQSTVERMERALATLAALSRTLPLDGESPEAKAALDRSVEIGERISRATTSLRRGPGDRPGDGASEARPPYRGGSAGSRR